MPTDIASLTLRAVVQQAASRGGLGRGVSGRAESLSGLTQTAQTFAASIFSSIRPLVLIVPSDTDVDRMTRDARFFVKAGNSLTNREVDRCVLPLPSPEVDPYREIAPHLDVASARARALVAMAKARARLVVVSAAALLPRVSDPTRIQTAVVDLDTGATLLPTAFADLLANAGFVRKDPVEAHGEFCTRGGVVDVFPAGDVLPIRVEFAGDSIESLRSFDPATQRSVEILTRTTIHPLRDQFEVESDNPASTDRSATVRDYINCAGADVVVSEPAQVVERLADQTDQLLAAFADAEARGESVSPPEVLQVNQDEIVAWFAGAPTFTSLEVGSTGAGGTPAFGMRHVACQPSSEYQGRLKEWVTHVKRASEQGDTILCVTETDARADRIIELLGESGLSAMKLGGEDHTQLATVLVTTGSVTRGFRLPEARFQIFAENDLFGEEHLIRHQRRGVAQSFLSDFRDLKVGDHVVHVEHGIGTFVGLQHLAVNRGQPTHEFVELRYATGDKLFVPVEQLDLLQKYTGASNPSLDRLGGTTWEKSKTRVKKSMRDMAEELLALYASRHALAGHAFSPDTHWQREFEEAFQYELTPDQRVAVADIKKDMERATAMDRLLCGDVGYGKTEVALRAAFKAVMDGKQVAVLTATTVLAFQHYETIRERFAAFPIRIEMLSRFRSKADQKVTLQDLEAGKVELVVGTHRLLSKDVLFRDLGLLVVDEEQRFGVAHKERIKQMRSRVDVLTMTATPIPRTLNMSLAGIRDMSVIETPPRDRLAIHTTVVKFDPQVITRAIRTELERGGQVYVVHNRVESIHSIASLIVRLIPEARVAVAHGQTTEHALEKVMIDFVAHKYDVLVATTIIENGLDIPNVNTIIVNHAERYGLAQLYQLRGRVGRSDRRAYAYLMIPADNALTPVARQWLSAIREFSELGSGFRVAALDLEIRGAGNLLGAQQSGHIEAIGFDMYVKLLEQTVRELQGEPVEEVHRARVNLGIELRIDESYIDETNQRLTVYRKVATAADESALTAAVDEVGDRYGTLHPSVARLAEYGRVRILADQMRVESIDREAELLVLKFGNDATVAVDHLLAFVEANDGVTLTPPGVIKVDLKQFAYHSATREHGTEMQREDDGRDRPRSWWTSRATSGSVVAGFSAAEMTAADPSIGRELEYLGRVQRVLEDLAGGD